MSREIEFDGRREMLMKSRVVRFVVPVIALGLVPIGEVGARTAEQRCSPATIRLTAPWKPAREPEYVASFGDFTPNFEVEPDERWEQLGEHRTSSILEVRTEVETRCDADACRTCAVAITARIGFEPSEILLHEDLRENRCARTLVWRHEQEHAAVTRRAQAMTMEKARLNLAWARSRQAGHVSAAGREESGQENVMRRVERDLMDALQEAVDYSDKANARLDRPERYRRESRRRWKRCRGRQFANRRRLSVSNRQALRTLRCRIGSISSRAAVSARRYYRGRTVSI